MKSSVFRVVVTVALLLGFFGTSLPLANAWDPATTQAGIAEKAALASRVHQVLSTSLGRPLGLFEPLAVAPDQRGTPRMKLLWQRLGSLSSAEGYRPSAATGANPALAWIAAGAALEGVPAERGRHHFLNPKTGKGLRDNPGATGGVHTLKLAFDGAGGLRGLATGTTFDMTGRPAPGWLLSPDNDLGLPQFLTAMEDSVGAPWANTRAASLVDAMMCLGGMGAVLADMGEPAHVRNDFRGAFMGGGTAGSWDQGSDFERYVARNFGRAGIPEGAPAVERASIEAFFTATDGMGLADQTQRRFFSTGTLPPDVKLDASTTPRQVRDEANESLQFPDPVVGPLRLRKGGRKYQTAEGVRQFAYERLAGSVRFFMDEAVYEDTARTWLPVVGSYVAGLYNNLLRAELAVSLAGVAPGRKVVVTLKGIKPGATGTLKLYSQSTDGARGAVGAPVQITASAVTGGGASFSFELPPGASRVAVSVRGQDAAGPFVAVAERAAE